ncbi:hypothetical protein STANM309S_06395 [Streptomyces tanashiensis]
MADSLEVVGPPNQSPLGLPERRLIERMGGRWQHHNGGDWSITSRAFPRACTRRTCRGPVTTTGRQFGRQFGEDGEPWCVMFNWDMYADVGLDHIVPKVNNVSVFTEWARTRDQWSDYPSIGAWTNLSQGGHTEVVVGFDETHVYTKGRQHRSRERRRRGPGLRRLLAQYGASQHEGRRLLRAGFRGRLSAHRRPRRSPGRYGRRLVALGRSSTAAFGHRGDSFGGRVRRAEHLSENRPGRARQGSGA